MNNNIQKTCINCGSQLSLTGVCYSCGSGDQSFKPKVYRRSTSLIIFMSLSIITNIVWIAVALVVIFSEDQLLLIQILAGVIAVSAVFDIVLAVNILRLKKWAFKIYVVLTVMICVLRLTSFDFFSIVVKGGLAFVIYKYDYKYFT